MEEMYGLPCPSAALTLASDAPPSRDQEQRGVARALVPDADQAGGVRLGDSRAAGRARTLDSFGTDPALGIALVPDPTAPGLELASALLAHRLQLAATEIGLPRYQPLAPRTGPLFVLPRCGVVPAVRGAGLELVDLLTARTSQFVDRARH